jgi:hypothetical protein
MKQKLVGKWLELQGKLTRNTGKEFKGRALVVLGDARRRLKRAIH